MKEDKDIQKLLKACQKGERWSQDMLYKMFFGYAMAICLRYAHTREEALEVLNDGFLKVFTKLEKYSQGLSFKGWLGRIMVNTAIDYLRKYEKHQFHMDISYAKEEELGEDALDKISQKEIIMAIQSLPTSYRLVFNLFAIEGYKHEEISKMLDISVGTSKSNLSVARNKLKKILFTQNLEKQKKHG